VFHLARSILGGRVLIEEFVAADVWPISHRWAPTEIVNFNINWVAQEVPFPLFGLHLRDGQSTEEFMVEVEKKVNAMIGEYTMNEYKAYKNLVKHKKRITRVFSKICGEKSFRSRRPGHTVKMPAIAVGSCSAAPLKAPRRRFLKKSKGNTDETTSSSVQPVKTKSLESTKQKRNSSENVSDAELQAATSLAQMSRKKAKKVVKKIVTTEVRQSLLPSTMTSSPNPTRKVFFSWPDLRFSLHEHCTPGSENEFVDIESFSDAVIEVVMEIETSAAAAAVEIVDPQPSGRQDEASPEFTKELEMTVHKGEDPAPEVPFVETRGSLPENQDPSPSMIVFNKSFGTSYRGELLSVGYEKIDAGSRLQIFVDS
jgi:hypothetical protein